MKKIRFAFSLTLLAGLFSTAVLIRFGPAPEVPARSTFAAPVAPPSSAPAPLRKRALPETWASAPGESSHKAQQPDLQDSTAGAQVVTPAGLPEVQPPKERRGERFLEGAEVLAQRDAPADLNGQVRRVKIVKARFKYPFLRVEQVLARQGGGEAVVSQREMVADHVLVRLKEGVTEMDLRALAQKHGGTIRKKMLAPHTYLVALGARDIDSVTDAVMQWTREAHAVAYAEADCLVHTTERVPNDVRFSEMWALRNTGQAGGTAGADIKATQAWASWTGSRAALVGVLDTGVDYTHEDLAANCWVNPGEIPGNGLDDDSNGFVDDVRGWNFAYDNNNPMDDNDHGSHVSGTIGAAGNNGLGVAGVCWNVSIVPVKFIDAAGSGTMSDGTDAIYYATRVGVSATSNSYIFSAFTKGGGGFSQAMKDAIDDAGNRGILFVAAAGNSAENNDITSPYPASYECPNVIAVAATDRNDQLAYFSSYGPASVHLGAPGRSILSCVYTGSVSGDGKYATFSGTSMATPHVAGVCALLKSRDMSLTSAAIKSLVLESVDPLPALQGKCVTGGRLNALKALLFIGPYVEEKNHTVDDDALGGTSGNGDGLVNPGERAGLAIRLNNLGRQPALGVSARLTLSSADPYLTILQDTVSYGDIPARTEANGSGSFLIQVAGGTPTPHPLPLVLTIQDSQGNIWTRNPAETVYNSSQIGGTVTLDGAPLSGATVTFTGPLSGTRTTAADGSYILGAVDGTHTLTVTQGSFLPAAPVSVTTPPGRTGVDFSFTTATVSGTVTDLGTGAPLGGTQLSFRGSFSGSVLTAADGTYALTNVYGRSGSLGLTAKRSGYFAEFQSAPLPPDAVRNFALGFPNITLSPASLSQTLAQNRTASQTLTIGNTGSLPLAWMVSSANVRSLAAGYDHSLALKSDGTVWAWGSNAYGQLGDGTLTNRTTPVPVSGLTGVSALVSGDYHGLALKPDGTVWAWGYNAVGQLGDGTLTNRTTPVRVSGLSGVTALAGGNMHSLALKPDGTVWAWGYNYAGQLGDGTFTNRTRPVPVSGLNGVSALASKLHHSLALKQDGTVWAWGFNNAGQLGDGTTTNRAAPVQVSGLTGVSALASGNNSSLALEQDGTVWAWGSNAYGQLGDGTLTNRLTPVQVSGLTGVSALAGGGSHSLALKPDGTAWAWGYNFSGQLGDGTTTNRTAPVPVSGLTGVSALAGGSVHSLALKLGGMWAWGYNGSGQLGDGTTANRTTPGLGIGLTNPTPPWLSLAPVSGTTAANSSSAVTVTFDSSGLPVGTYSTTLFAASNDLETPWIDVPVSLAVQGSNTPPAIVSAPWANPNPVTLPSTTAVNVVASDSDNGPSALTYTWSKLSGPGTVSFLPNGTTASSASTASFSAAGSYVLRVTVFDGAAGVAGDVAVTVNPSANQPPAVAAAAGAVPNPVTGTTTALSVLGADDGGEANLIYTWSWTGPAGVTFSANGTNAAKNSTAAFTAAGSYTLTAAIRDPGGLTAASSVAVTVNQTLTSIAVSPASVAVPVNGTQQFAATAKDQFGNALAPQPAFAWTVNGGGAINASGLFTAAAAAGGPFTVTVSSGGKSGTASLTVTALAGPVAYWKLDEATGTLASDSSGNGNTGTLVNGPLWAAGKVGNALSLDGVNDYVDAGSGASLNLTAEVSVAAWIKFSATGRDQKIAGNQNGVSGGYKLGVFSANNKVEFEIRNSANVPYLNRGVAGGTALASGTWVHVVGVFSRAGGFIRTYVNGTLDRELLTGGVLAATSGSFKLGREPYSATGFWGGLLDDVRVYNRALSAAEIAALAGGTNQPPTVAVAASAVPNPVTGTTTSLSVLGADDGGEANLTYTWSASGPAAVAFGANATNAAKSTTAAFTAAGSYTLTAAIRDAGGLTAASSVAVTVNQTLTSITVSPASVAVPVNGTQQFAAAAKDQFGNAMTPQPALTWTVSGGGAIDASGLFTAGAAAGGPFTVTASSGSKSGTASLTVTALAGPVACWKLDETTGTLASDSSGNGNIGTLLGGAAWATGKIGGALNFDGTNDYVEAPHKSILNVSSVTLAAWVYVRSAGEGSILDKRGPGGTGGCQIRVQGNIFPLDLNFMVKDPVTNETQLIALGKIPQNTWVHVAGVFDNAANTMQVYVNGALAGTRTGVTADPSVNPNPAPLRLGEVSGWNIAMPSAYNLNGLLDEVRVYNRPLSAVEMATLAHPAGLGGILLQKPNTGEVFLWQMR